MNYEIDEEKIKENIESEIPLVYQVHHIDKENSDFFINVAQKILDIIKMPYMRNQVGYIIRELVYNADKSNLKRIHFMLNDLDINNPDDYDRGMSTFGTDFRTRLEEYRHEMERKEMYIKMIFLFQNKKMIIAVKNNSMPTLQEQDRIIMKIAQSKSMHDIAEAYMNMDDTSEGAGLGTITVMMMLRSLGVGDNTYKFRTNPTKNETIVQLAIPLNAVTIEHTEKVSEAIANEVRAIPQFPENISKLQSMLSQDQETAFSEFGKVIARDPSMSAELLKIVNSSQYMLPHKVSNITNALSLVGLKGLKGLLYSYGTQKTLSHKYGPLDELWEHSYRCASYAYNIAKDHGFRAIMDDVYIGGILHDIGKIVVMQLHPNMIEKINQYCLDRGIEADFIEGLAVGISHAKIGALISTKWNFPESLVAPIEFHHLPMLAPDDFKNIVSIVYLADTLCSLREGRFNYYMAERPILDQFKISSEDDLIKLESKYNHQYEIQKEKEGL